MQHALKNKLAPQRFQQLLLKWFDKHGRKQLPWQKNKTPYRVWISEVMLQQTQVNTVIPYYERFMSAFPTLKSLANAHEDDVLHLWAGLGYYSRARNLHRAAQMIVMHHQNKFPDTYDALIQLPGIGSSTAGAILAIAFAKHATILDGNVKRVLARFAEITSPINEKNTENILWDLAKTYTPHKRIADYTQAMMDLGATLCTRNHPACTECPLKSHCKAYHAGSAPLLPAKKATRALPTHHATFLLLQQNGHFFLQKRQSKGIWGGLWSLPELKGQPDKKQISKYCREHLQLIIKKDTALPPFTHTFSHYHLILHPVLIEIKTTKRIPLESPQQIWYNPKQPNRVGLPKPIQTLLSRLP